MWVEPDLNLSGSEALIRQLTLGRTYFKETFGDVETPVLWLPDTFGFPAQTPQLMQLAGLKWFATSKLNWNQYNPVPSSTHQWEGLDGSRVLAHVLTTPRDVQYLPFPTNYKSDPSSPWQKGTVENTNRRARRWLPRKRNIRSMTNQDMKEICDRLNNTPRKCLGWKTPAEVFREKITEEPR